MHRPGSAHCENNVHRTAYLINPCTTLCTARLPSGAAIRVRDDKYDVTDPGALETLVLPSPCSSGQIWTLVTPAYKMALVSQVDKTNWTLRYWEFAVAAVVQ